MPGTDAAEETCQEIRLADLLRARRGEIVEAVVAAVPERLPPFRAIPAEELAPVVGDYLDVLALAIELASTTPLETFVQSLDRDWPSARVPVDDVIRAFYVVGDCCRAALADTAGPDDLAALDAWTREGVALFARFAVTFLAGRLAGEVARYRREEARLLSLQRVSAAVVGDLDLDRTLEVVVDEAARLMDAAAVSLRLLDEESGALRLIAAGGSGDALLYGESLPIEGSLAGLCLRCGQPLVATDTQSDPRLAPEVRAQSTLRSLLVAPLRVRDRVIGALLVGDPRPGRFTEADGAFLGLFADQAASAIENATLYQQAQGQIEELAIVQRVTQSISRSLDLEELFQTIYEEIRAVMPADAFLIGLRRPDDGYDLAFVVDGGQRYAPQHDFAFSAPLLAAVEERRPVIIGDIYADGAPKLKSVGSPRTGVRSILTVPLLKGEEAIGLLSAQSYTPHHYRECDARLLLTIATQAVVAIENARLYQQARTLAVSEERNRLAREIHDTLAQGLIGIILYLERLELTLPADDQTLRPWVERALALARANLDEARRSVHDLRAAPLEGRTLPEALAHLVAEVRAEGGFHVTLATPASLPLLAARVETALFRVAQEALANCRKHARCRRVWVTLALEREDLILEIRDDGRGMDAEAAAGRAGHFGLATMRERVGQVGGDLAIESVPRRGTRVRARIPLRLAVYSEGSAAR